MTEKQFRYSFAQFLLERIQAYGKTLHYLRSRCRVHVFEAFNGSKDFTPHSISNILESVPIAGQESEDVWRQYIGRTPESVEEYLQASLRRYGFEKIVAATGVCANTLLSFMTPFRGKKSSPKRRKTFPSLKMWERQISPNLGMEINDPHELWTRSSMDFWRQEQGRNTLGARVETILDEKRTGIQNLIRHRPAPLADMSERQLRAFIADFRCGKECSWSDVQKFCDALDLNNSCRKDLLHTIADTLLLREKDFIPFRSSPTWVHCEPILKEMILQAYMDGKDVSAVLKKNVLDKVTDSDFSLLKVVVYSEEDVPIRKSNKRRSYAVTPSITSVSKTSASLPSESPSLLSRRAQ